MAESRTEEANAEMEKTITAIMPEEIIEIGKVERAHLQHPMDIQVQLRQHLTTAPQRVPPRQIMVHPRKPHPMATELHLVQQLAMEHLRKHLNLIMEHHLVQILATEHPHKHRKQATELRLLVLNQVMEHLHRPPQTVMGPLQTTEHHQKQLMTVMELLQMTLERDTAPLPKNLSPLMLFLLTQVMGHPPMALAVATVRLPALATVLLQLLAQITAYRLRIQLLRMVPPVKAARATGRLPQAPTQAMVRLHLQVRVTVPLLMIFYRATLENELNVKYYHVIKSTSCQSF